MAKVAYQYLGAATAVESSCPQAGVKLTNAGGDGDSGDDWSGLDHFSRIADHHWIKDGTTATDIERIQYGYTRASLMQFKLHRSPTLHLCFPSPQLFNMNASKQIAVKVVFAVLLVIIHGAALNSATGSVSEDGAEHFVGILNGAEFVGLFQDGTLVEKLYSTKKAKSPQDAIDKRNEGMWLCVIYENNRKAFKFTNFRVRDGRIRIRNVETGEFVIEVRVGDIRRILLARSGLLREELRK